MALRRGCRVVLTAALVAAGTIVALATPASAATPAEATAAAAAHAGQSGVTSFLSVVDRASGQVVGETANAGSQVASESIMKLFLASYYLVTYSGYQNTPAALLTQISFMIRYSDDQTADNLFTSDAIPTMAARYGLIATTNATDDPGHWGAARITAHDMAHFLYAMSRDAEVGPWLLNVMAQVAPTGSGADATFDQHYGMNALTGVHGSKQGWGCDSFWTSQSCAIHSVGYSGNYFIAVLQLGAGYPDPMRSTASFSASTIAGSGERVVTPPVIPPKDGDFVINPIVGGVYRIAGGAPVLVSSWDHFGGRQALTPITVEEWLALRLYPADGTFLSAAGYNAVYRVVGGAPVYVTSWKPFGGAKPTITVDPAAIAHAGDAGGFAHLRNRPLDGTFVRAVGRADVYRVAGGGLVYVPSWQPFGGVQTTIAVSTEVIAKGGAVNRWSRLDYFPASGTFLRGLPGGVPYEVRHDHVVRVTSWAPFGGPRPVAWVSQAAISRAGIGGSYDHLLQPTG